MECNIEWDIGGKDISLTTAAGPSGTNALELRKNTSITKSVKNLESELKLLNKNIECITLILFKDLTKNMTEEASNKIEEALVKLKK